jgi:tRNA dimethylallyltransferase
MKKLPKILVIIGPTASGKTRLAVALARELNGEIISADSRQVYKGMNIGTGKDLAEYGTGKSAVAYHLIDVADPKMPYDLYQYQKAAYKAILSVLKRDKLPIIVGGSGLYLQAGAIDMKGRFVHVLWLDALK